jgi:hypothetical protein
LRQSSFTAAGGSNQEDLLAGGIAVFEREVLLSAETVEGVFKSVAGVLIGKDDPVLERIIPCDRSRGDFTTLCRGPGCLGWKTAEKEKNGWNYHPFMCYDKSSHRNHP